MLQWQAAIVAGLVGGLLNGFFAAGGLAMPRIVRGADGSTILDPGIFGNIIVGGVAGLVLWILNAGPTADFTAAIMPLPSVAAFFSGLGGARVLTGIIEKQASDANLAGLSKTLQELASRREPGGGPPA